ncbi:NAD(P)-binding protein [Byssothecium circinans]|uniref:NAD(P)-binding protein n=1 Tax=Byssothecium circinans TaxID=147558 RepID=A0A6A5TV86_9PLEO|nr:NAD(P)-binding protein [Byssothecium circinans]
MTTKHALITGGSRGIGLAIAQHLAQKNYTCTLISRSDSALEAAVSTLPSPSSPISSTAPRHQHSYIAGDISSPTFWHPSTFSSLPISKSGIDVVVNSAGITQSSLLSRTSEDDIRGVIDTNLTGMVVGTRFLLRNRFLRGRSRVGRVRDEEGSEAEKSHSPVIINVASLLGLKEGYGAVAYAASKAGVLGFTRALATEVGPMGIRVNAIVPGYIETDMTKDLDQASITQRIPLRRFGRPEEIASAALFLAENEYAHNCIINLDGGLSAT